MNTPNHVGDNTINELFDLAVEITKEHAKNLQADPSLAAKLDSDPLAQAAYANELWRGGPVLPTTLPRMFDLHYFFDSIAPPQERWSVVDLATYDGGFGSEPPCTFVGRGASEKEARMALLKQFREYDGVEPEPTPRARVIHHSTATDPADVVYEVERFDEADFDADLDSDPR